MKDHQMETDIPQDRCSDNAIVRRNLAQAGISVNQTCWEWCTLSLLHSACHSDSAPVLLLHGVTYSSASVFDLEVPDHERTSYSTLLQLSARGVDSWALDFAGYGLSETPDYGRLETPDDYVSQVRRAASEIRALTGKKPVLVGWSWGAQMACRTAGAFPSEFAGLAFWGGGWGGSGHLKTWQKRPLPTMQRRQNTSAHASADFLNPNNYRSEVKDAFVKHALWLDPTSPTTGITHSILNLPLHSPKSILCPTLIVHGDGDPVSDKQDMFDFCNELGDNLVGYRIIPNSDHNTQFSESRHILFECLTNFTKNIIGDH
ncbi:alpha/beta hydrolase (plasmid) [Neorhizobium sp. DAR64861/K0K2]|uniref:alpha/beta hydrolase n=1 Tax=Neorhizobium sp. DAR64861/K0K2 TaxID=3421956 RepID=UPI003D296388